MTARARTRLQLAADLARAVAEDAVDVVFQPIVDLDGRRVVGVEALARWTHPQRGPVPPEEFITLAERNGLILRLGDRVLEHALTAHRTLTRGQPDARLTIAINLSARQLRDEHLVERIGASLAAFGVPGDRLVLELTEAVMLEDVDLALVTMQALRDLGVRFAIDDFGTGYSSLSYLRRLPVDIVKIDASFIHDLTDDHALNFFVVGDNLLKGAALNTVQIAEELVARGLV
jgi:EAL domain-containing protein (putative c-di-GMP-specific phosphodiesterase class I)